MDLVILNTNFEVVGILDLFESVIWTERYSSCGDFEIYTAITEELVELLKYDYYISKSDTDVMMIIEYREFVSNLENGDKMIIKGRSLSSILDRRIVWKQTILTGNFQTAIQTLLNENIINPTDTNRKLDNFIFEASTDPAVTNLTIEAQVTGDTLYTVIEALCSEKNIGFKLTYVDGSFVFKLYSGKDRSYSQTANPFVVFSPDYDNLMSSNYKETKMAFKTVGLVAGEGEGSERKMVSVTSEDGAGTGLGRREIFIDARDISSTTDVGTLTEQEYSSQLTQRGKEKLAEAKFGALFEGLAIHNFMYIFNQDFFMGDIVQIRNEYGMEAKSRVTEIIWSFGESGQEIYPTLTSIE